MKRHYIFTIIMGLLCSVATLQAQENTYSGITYEFQGWPSGVAHLVGDQGTATVVSATDSVLQSGTLTIPTRVVTAANPSRTYYYTVRAIGDYAFMDKSTLREVNLPTSLTSIGTSAFQACTSLTSITIGPNIQAIGARAFYGCSNLKRITIEATTPPEISGTPFGNISSDAVIIVPEGSVDAYKSDAQWNRYNISDGTNNISLDGIRYHLYDPENAQEAYAAVVGVSTSLLSLTLPETIEYGGISYPVKVIKADALAGCTFILSADLPSRLTEIETGAFSPCTNLTTLTIRSQAIANGSYLTQTFPYVQEVTFDGNVERIASNFFYRSTTLTHVNINGHVATAGSNAFMQCPRLTDLTINSAAFATYDYNNINGLDKVFNSTLQTITFGNEVHRIGVYAFARLSGLTKVVLPPTLVTIADASFYNCPKLSEIELPYGLETIGSQAFNACTSIANMLIPESVTSIGELAFNNCKSVRVKKGTGTLLLIWGSKYDPLDDANGNKLYRPVISSRSSTQTTITTVIENYLEGYDYYLNDEKIHNLYKFTGLHPDYTIYAALTVKYGDITYRQPTSTQMKTTGISPRAVADKHTASSLLVVPSWTHGDANVTAYSTTIGGKTSNDSQIKLTGLNPGSSYNATVRITVTDDAGQKWTYSSSTNLTTDALTFTTKPAKVISPGNVIVAATSNIDDEETTAGFEWRRTDWSDEFPSNTGGSYIYGGEMEGYIRNVYTGALWRVRPYYLASSGTYYYGDWIGFDPTNTSYFVPTVHTYEGVSVKGNTALVKGYALRGSEAVTVQGFKYWKLTSSVKERDDISERREITIPSNAKTIEAEGVIMTVTLADLDYNSDYAYVAFVKTADGETYYGEQQTFSTERPSTTEDVNGDGSIDTQDVLAIYDFMQQYTTGMTIGVEDVNGDGKVDTQDVLKVYDYIQSH